MTTNSVKTYISNKAAFLHSWKLVIFQRSCIRLSFMHKAFVLTSKLSSLPRPFYLTPEQLQQQLIALPLVPPQTILSTEPNYRALFKKVQYCYTKHFLIIPIFYRIVLQYSRSSSLSIKPFLPFLSLPMILVSSLFPPPFHPTTFRSVPTMCQAPSQVQRTYQCLHRAYTLAGGERHETKIQQVRQWGAAVEKN